MRTYLECLSSLDLQIFPSPLSSTLKVTSLWDGSHLISSSLCRLQPYHNMYYTTDIYVQRVFAARDLVFLGLNTLSCYFVLSNTL